MSKMATQKRREKQGLLRLLIITAATVLLILFIAASVAYGGIVKELYPADGASFIFLSVGQANSSLIFIDGQTLVIDTGSNDSEETLLSAFSYYGVREIDTILLTHADEDHAGGLDVLLEAYSVSRVVLTEGIYNALDGTRGKRILERVLATEETSLVTVSAGDILTVGNASLEFLTPAETDPEILEGGNEASLVTLVEYGETSAVFPGDTDQAGEIRAIRAISKHHSGFRCDLLLVAHHGSDTSTCERFAEYLKPRYAVISCGKFNSYGHPSSEVVKRLEAAGAVICRTDLEGTLIFHSDGKTVTPIRN